MVTTIDTRVADTASRRQSLPTNLEAWAPDLMMTVLVASVDRSRLSDEDVVRLMTARDRLVSHLQAERAADIAEVAGRVAPEHDYFDEFAALEVGSALHLTTMAASYEVAFARDLTERIPRSVLC